MLIVQKYGGTSVADPARIRNVAKRAAATRNAGHDVVVVVSAMGGETDRLVKLAAEMHTDPPEREMDLLLSSGERVTVALLAMALAAQNVPAQAFTGRQVGIETDGDHTRARITRVTGDRLRQSVAAGMVPIVAGFQGINAASDVTTLGRGGSDLTAVAVAAALKADRCDICTDVDGVYTADPRIVPDARKLDRVTFEEMLELASLGAKVLQTRSVLLAMRHGVPLQVRSSFNDTPGTLVTAEDEQMEQEEVSGITYDRHQAKITLAGVPDHPGVASRIFRSVSDANILIDMIIQNISHRGSTDISFTVPRDDLARVRGVVEAIDLEDIDLKSTGMESTDVEGHSMTVDADASIAKVSVVGVGMRSHSGVATRMFEALAAEDVNILMISTSEIKISCVIHEAHMERAVRALHTAFGLGTAAGATP